MTTLHEDCGIKMNLSFPISTKIKTKPKPKPKTSITIPQKAQNK